MIFENLTAWVAQIFIIGSLGALLPLVFRVRHPRSQLAYCHLLLAAYFVLPLVQPWQHAVVVLNTGNGAQTAGRALPATISTPSVATPIRWDFIVLSILVTGTVLRLSWLAFGLWQIRKYRLAARPLYPLPDSIIAARRIAGADALFCKSPNAGSPVTFGLLRPIVLLPETFVTLSEEAQRGIACHELLHVRRKDWLVTLFEEAAGSLFWFHPAVWWLLAQTRLAREQLVDAEVVRMTASRESYVDALLAVAGVAHTSDLAPAPLFLGKRHLTQRMHSLLEEVSMSRLRLVSSYVSMAALLVIVGWGMSLSFPLTGEAEIRVAAAQNPAPQTPPGYVVNRAPLSYPTEAMRKRVEGTVVVELTFNANGEITDSHVLSGPEELRQAGLQTALQGKYGIDVVRTLQVVVDFKLPPPTQQGTGQRGGGPPVVGKTVGTAELGGTVRDISGIPLPGVTVSATNAATGTRAVGVTNSAGTYLFPALAGATYAVSAELTGFQTVVFSNVQLSGSQRVRLNFGLQTGVGTNSTASVAPLSPAPPPPFPPPPVPTSNPVRVRVGGNVANANLIQQVPPVYPQAAKDARIEGAVVLEAEINKDGVVENLKVITGPPLLIQAAIDAVKQWAYRPTMLNGQPIDVVTTITLNFSLPESEK